MTVGFQLSPQQKRLWLLQHESQAYRAHCVVQLDGNLQSGALRKTIQDVIGRHEILRTTFQNVPGMRFPVQVISESCTHLYQRVDLSGLDYQDQQVRTDDLSRDLERIPFDFERGPLLHIILVKLSPWKHLLFINLPSLCADPWTLNRLVQELVESYASRFNDELDSESVIQYADFCEWQNELLKDEEADIAGEFWRWQELSDIASQELPYQARHSRNTGFAPAVFSLIIRPSLNTRLAWILGKYDVSATVFLLTCWRILLWRLTGQPDTVVGCVFNGRKFENLWRSMGLFAKTLPIYGRFQGDCPLMDGIRQVNESVRELDAWQEYMVSPPGEGVNEDFAAPLFFPVSFEFEEKTTKYDVGDLSFWVQEQYSCVDSFRIKLSCIRLDDFLVAQFWYDEKLFQRQDVQRLANHFARFMESALQSPQSPIAALEFLTEGERHQLLQEWNDTQKDCPAAGCIYQLFESQAESSSDAIAVHYNGKQLTFEDLNRRANQLAHHLKRLGVGPDVLVGIAAERSVELVVALLGVLKAGGAYVPLDPEYPKSRLDFMLADAGASVLLTQSHLLDRLPKTESRLLCLDRECPSIASESVENPAPVATAENLVYMIYTSGSTGQPKGALNTHRGLYNRLAWMQQQYKLTLSDRVLQKTPFSFDVSVWEFYWPLMTGARLVLAKPGGHRDSGYLRHTIRENGITTLHFVPSMLRVFLEDDEVRQCESVRQVICSGESLPFDLQERFFERMKARLHNLYGPTEASIDVTFWECQQGKSKVVPIGRPIDNIQVYILDEGLRPEPISLDGELCIGGVGLARGYFNRPGLTAEKFIPDPFSAQPGARLYKTGDRARYLSDGEIEYLGRVDNQVKIRGQRIEPGEIEAILSQHPAVQESVVVPREESSGGPRLVAYIVPDQRHAFTVRQLLRFEREGLPNGLSKWELPNGLQIFTQHKVETEFVYQEIFEDQAYLKHGITLEEGSIVFDVGANMGLFTLFVSRVCQNPTIYAFEPIPPVFKILRLNTQLYDLDVRLFECALGSENGSASFTYYPQASVLSGRFADADAEREIIKSFLLYQQRENLTRGVSREELDAVLEKRLESESFTCQMRTLSAVIRENGVDRIDLLKINVEKSEWDALAGIADEDWPKIRQVVVEVHNLNGRLRQISDLLKSKGYALAVEQDRSLQNTGLYTIYGERSGERTTTRDPDQHSWREQPQGWTSESQLGSELRRFLKDELPDYMIPSAFIMLDTIPLTSNGKVDHRSLPNPQISRLRLERSYAPPWTDSERIITDVWREALQVDRVGLYDNFFDLGGHSYLMAEVHNKLKDRFKKDWPLTELFKYPTVKSLAHYMDQRRDYPFAPEPTDDRIEQLKDGRNRLKQRAQQGRQFGGAGEGS